jgi:MFS family permease
MITSIVAVLLAIPVGSLSDRIGKEKILTAGYLIYAIVYYGFGVTSHVGAIVALFAMYGLYSAATDGIQKAFISDITDKNKQGTGLGIYNALLGITLLPASLIAGVLYDKVNSRVPFYFGAATALLSGLLMLIFIRLNRKQEPAKNPSGDLN